MVRCHVCSSVCEVLVYGFALKIAPQSTAVPNDEAPTPISFTLPTMQCKVVDMSVTAEVKNEAMVWTKPAPKVLLFMSQLQVPLSFSLLCHKRENQTQAVPCVDYGKLYCDMLWSRPRGARGCTSVSLCRKGKLRLEQIHHRSGNCDEQRAREREYRWKAPWVTQHEIFIMWYFMTFWWVRLQSISCFLWRIGGGGEVCIKSYGFTPTIAKVIIYMCDCVYVRARVLFIVLLIGFIFNFFYT